jgi:hypothetical protein
MPKVKQTAAIDIEEDDYLKNEYIWKKIIFT